jgi:hypothetical protein
MSMNPSDETGPECSPRDYFEEVFEEDTCRPFEVLCDSHVGNNPISEQIKVFLQQRDGGPAEFFACMEELSKSPEQEQEALRNIVEEFSWFEKALAVIAGDVEME